MKIPDSLTRALARQRVLLNKQSPHILFVGGIVGVVTATVLACRATLKVGDVLDEMKDDIDEIKNDELQPYISHRKTPEIDRRREMAMEYAHGGVAITRLYAPAVIIGTVSIAALTKSHITLSKRNAALTAAYVAVEKAFGEYRGRVRKEVGDKRELELYHDAKIEVTKDKDGVEQKMITRNSDGSSIYARIFDERNRNWVNNAESTRFFLEANQKYFNDRLATYKHVFLNEVYDSLGFQRTPAGQMVGWVYGGEGDNYIDFNIYNVGNADFVINGDRSVLLDFNVDGVIFELI